MNMKKRGIPGLNANVEQPYVMILQRHLMPGLLPHGYLASNRDG